MKAWLRTKRQGKSQEQIAKMAGITQQMYSKIERGEANPSVEVAKRIAAVLSFPWTRFFEEDEPDQTANRRQTAGGIEGRQRT